MILMAYLLEALSPSGRTRFSSKPLRHAVNTPKKYVYWISILVWGHMPIAPRSCLQVGEGLARAKQSYGEWLLAPNDPEVVGDDQAPDVTGHTTELFERLYPNGKVTLVVLEFGVKSYEHTAEILMREHRLTRQVGEDDQELQQSRQDLSLAFYPQDKYWRRAVWNHSLQAIEPIIKSIGWPLDYEFTYADFTVRYKNSK